MASPKLKTPTKRTTPHPTDIMETPNTPEESGMSVALQSGENARLFNEQENVFEMIYGYKDPETGELHKEFEVRDITGRDAEAVQKAETRSNGAKVVTTLLSRCVVRIGPHESAKLGQGQWFELIRSLLVGDQDYMMVKLREYSDEDPLKTTHVCPNERCKAKLNSEILPRELEIIPFKSASIPFILPRGYRDRKGVLHREGKLRVPTGFDREILLPIAQQNLARAETLMLTRVMTFDDGFPIDDDVTGNMSVKDRNYLTGLQKDYYFGVNLDVPIVCTTCGESFIGTLNAINFI